MGRTGAMANWWQRFTRIFTRVDARAPDPLPDPLRQAQVICPSPKGRGANDLTVWDEDVEIAPEVAYGALVRALGWAKGFGIYFVKCAPAEGRRLVERLRGDVPEKAMDLLSLTDPIDNLYDRIAALPNVQDLNVLFIEGIETSLYEYEQHHLWEDDADRYHYGQSGVPRLLGHLNLSRERFKDFNLCLVFLVPQFALKYLIHRAPDFFDWHSGVFEFAMDKRQILSEASSLENYRFRKSNPTHLSQEEVRQNLLRIQALLEEKDLSVDRKASLFFEQGRLFEIAENWEGAVAAYDAALKIKPDYHEALNNKGLALLDLGRYEDAIAAYDAALQIKPDTHEALSGKGVALGYLGRYEEAIAAHDAALKIKPDYESALYNKACAYALQNQLEPTLDNLAQAIQLKPDHYRKMAKTDSDFDAIRDDPRFQTLLQ
jgi:lipoprotein NlpI